MDIEFKFYNINFYNIKENPLYCKEIDIEADEKMCRICLETDGDLINVCNCKGSIGFVHKECIETWINTTEIVEHQKMCQICKSEYNFDLIEKKTKKEYYLSTTWMTYLFIIFIIILISFTITYIYLN